GCTASAQFPPNPAYTQTLYNSNTAPSQGQHTVNVPGGTITFTISGSTVTSWSSTVPVDALIVKGGSDAYIYKYAPASFGDPAANAHSPQGTQAGALSHILFCNNG